MKLMVSTKPVRTTYRKSYHWRPLLLVCRQEKECRIVFEKNFVVYGIEQNLL